MHVMDAAAYIVAQFAGALAARSMALCILGTRQSVTVVDNASVFGAEALGAFWLATGVASVVLGKAPAAAAGLTIGGSLLFGISFAAPISNGVLNPAVALGIGSFSVVYCIAPIVGAAVAMLIYRFVLARE